MVDRLLHPKLLILHGSSLSSRSMPHFPMVTTVCSLATHATHSTLRTANLKTAQTLAKVLRLDRFTCLAMRSTPINYALVTHSHSLYNGALMRLRLRRITRCLPICSARRSTRRRTVRSGQAKIAIPLTPQLPHSGQDWHSPTSVTSSSHQIPHPASINLSSA